MTILASDPFTGTGALGGNWAQSDNDGDTMDRSSDQVVSSRTNSDAGARYTAISWPNDQYSIVIFGPTSADGVGAGYGPTVRDHTVGTTRDFYRVVGNASGFAFGEFTGGTFTSITSGAGTTFTAGDSLELRFNGTSYSARKNGAAPFISGTHSAHSAGSAGVTHSSTTTLGNGLASWEGGDLQEGPGVNAPTTRASARRPEDDDEDERQFNEVDIRNWWRSALNWRRSRSGLLVPA